MRLQILKEYVVYTKKNATHEANSFPCLIQAEKLQGKKVNVAGFQVVVNIWPELDNHPFQAVVFNLFKSSRPL